MKTSEYVAGLNFTDLGIGSGTLLWGFRACARGGAKCCAVVRGFEHTLPGQGAEALAGLLEFARLLGNGGHRGVLLAMPGCTGVTADELSVVSAFSAAHNENLALCEAHLSWLFAGSPPHEAIQSVAEVAQIFRDQNIPFNGPNIELKRRALAHDKGVVVAGGYA